MVVGNNQPSVIKKNDLFFIISLLTLITFIVLFISRNLDDNRLTSWQWTFESVNAANIFLAVSAVIPLSFILSKISIPAGYYGALLFILSFSVEMIFWREPEVIIDSSRYFTQAKYLEVYGIRFFMDEWGRAVNAWTDMPLIPFLYGLIFKFLGEIRVYIQIFTTILFSTTVVITYMIGKALWDEDTGFTGGMLLIGMPYLLTQPPLMLVDVPTMFFFMLSVLTFHRGLNNGGIWLGLSSLAIVLTFFSKYSAWLMLSVLVVIFLVYLKIVCSPSPSPPPLKGVGTKDNLPLIRRKKTGGDTSLFIGEITSVPLPLREGLGEGRRIILFRGMLIMSLAALVTGMVFFYKYDVFSEQMRLLMTFQKPGLKRWSEGFLSTFFFQIHPFITLSAVYSGYVAFKKRDWKYAIIASLVLLVIIMQIKRIRYIIMVFPMVALMASYGLQRINDREVRRFCVLCIIISSLVIAIFAYLPFMQKMSVVNLKDAGEFLNSMEESYAEVFTVTPVDPVANIIVSVPVLDLFTSKTIIHNNDAAPVYPSAEKIDKSPLRFTWEYSIPSYYLNKTSSKEDPAVVVISGDIPKELPGNIVSRLEGYQLTKEFNKYEGIFSLRTGVQIYQKKKDDR